MRKPSYQENREWLAIHRADVHHAIAKLKRKQQHERACKQEEQPMDNQAMKVTHIFDRLNKLSMCINGKFNMYKRSPFYCGFHYQGDYVKKMVTDERVRQISAGIAKPKKNMDSIVQAKPNSTIASLYSYDNKKLRKVRDKAKEHFEESTQKDRAWSKKWQEQCRVMQDYVDAKKEQIKDMIATEQIPLNKCGEVLEDFERFQGGTEGFIRHVD